MVFKLPSRIDLTLSLPMNTKWVTHTITILQHLLRNCYCVCDHFVFIGKEKVKKTLELDMIQDLIFSDNLAGCFKEFCTRLFGQIAICDAVGLESQKNNDPTLGRKSSQVFYKWIIDDNSIIFLVFSV